MILSAMQSQLGGGPAVDPRRELGRIRFRRAVALMVMTLVLPGSAQLVAGRRELGRIAMRIWFGLLLTALFLLVVELVSHSFVFWFLSNTVVLGVVRLVLMALAIGWAFLLVDAWRIGEPLALRQKQRLAMVGINGLLCFSVAGSLLFASHLVNVHKDWLLATFASGPASEIHNSSTGRSRRSMRDRPPIGNMTISTVRILKAEASAACAASCSNTLAKRPRIKVANTGVESYPSAVTIRNSSSRTKVKCSRTGTPRTWKAFTVPAVPPCSPAIEKLFTGPP